MLHEEIYKNHTIQIMPDPYPESPRDWSNISTMICFHRRYKIGDDHSFDHNDYSGWES
jgi:hypothetical protein